VESDGAGWETKLTAMVPLTERDDRERDHLDGPVRKASACGGREAGGAGWAKGQVCQ
jgi:hypothetical protein